VYDSVEARRHWDVHVHRNIAFADVFDKHECVYLSSESENVLESIDADKVYIIGGLVDHNAHKGLCHRLAVDNGIAHARLPIDRCVRAPMSERSPFTDTSN
jgi:tRNA (guanine9-N1)-methyltransferase